MFTKSILLLAVSALSVATPVRRQSDGCKPKPPAGSTTVPTLPSTGGDDNLVSPPANVTLAKIGLGHGIQNYTCTLTTPTTGQATLSAAATGALAVLYDVTKLYPTGSGSALTIEKFQALTTNILWGTELPLNIDESAATDVSFPATSDPFPAPAPVTLPGLAPIPFLGHHFFIGKTPTFDLPQSGLHAAVKKDDSVAAPASADPGPSGTGAVSWLQLSDNGSSKGVAYVYRVTTAGGNPLPCSAEGESFSVPYSAMYWFYAPA